MKKKKLRTWCYVQKPASYEMACDKCGGKNIEWSEFEHMIWCYDCKIDTSGNGGIFDGPIPLEAAKMFGQSFYRFYFKDKSIRKMEVKGDKLVWKKREEAI